MMKNDRIKPTIVVEPCGWTPAQGLFNAGCWLIVATVIAMLVMWPVAASFPRVLFHWAIRAAVAFLTAWMMFGIAQSKASFVGVSVSAMAIVATCLVLLSHHVAATSQAFITHYGQVAGSEWLDLRVIFFLNISSLAGIGFCTAIRHDGGGDTNTLIEIFARRF